MTTGDRARRTSSGSTLRLVSSQSGPEVSPGQGTTIPGVPADVDVESVLLPGRRQSVTAGRHWVVRTAAAYGATGMANQVVELLSSELLANAVLHGPEGETVGLELRSSPTTIRVAVSDAAAQGPVVMEPDPSALNGRGMAIVEAMSSRWGFQQHEEGGKTVWFELDLDEF